MQEQPVPDIGPQDVLVKVHKTGICGTDVHIFNWDEWASRTVPIPMITGHEYAGEIAALARRCATSASAACFRRGTRGGRIKPRGARRQISPGSGHQGHWGKLPGAFAEYVRVPAFNVIALPDSVDDEIGAILDPLGNAVHTTLSFDIVGEDV